jgi:hypothetical protein
MLDFHEFSSCLRNALPLPPRSSTRGNVRDTNLSIAREEALQKTKLPLISIPLTDSERTAAKAIQEREFEHSILVRKRKREMSTSLVAKEYLSETDGDDDLDSLCRISLQNNGKVEREDQSLALDMFAPGEWMCCTCGNAPNPVTCFSLFIFARKLLRLNVIMIIVIRRMKKIAVCAVRTDSFKLRLKAALSQILWSKQQIMIMGRKCLKRLVIGSVICVDTTQIRYTFFYASEKFVVVFFC